MKKYLKIIIPLFFVSIISAIILADVIIENSTNNLVYNDINKIPHNKVGLLLGTSKYLKSGFSNLYFKYRIEATTNLFKAHKIEYVVISGDNSKKDYNEPLDMKNELIKSGIQDSLIILDYAGFRTFDSVIRINKIFGQNNFTVISQEFHNKRAIYIAKYFGFKAIGYNAQEVNLYSGIKTQIREKFARVKVFIDLLINKKPKFLGNKIEIK